MKTKDKRNWVIFITLSAALLLTTGSIGCNGDSGDSNLPPALQAWEQVGSQVSSSDAESQNPVMILSTPTVGYRHASYQVALHTWDNNTWGAPVGNPRDPSNNNYETFYGPPNFCEVDDTVYAAFSHYGESSSQGGAFYDRVFAYSWDATNGWQAMNGGNEISETYPTDIYDANEPTIVCRPNEDYPVVIAWIEVINTPADASDGVNVASFDQNGLWRSGRISRNDTIGSFYTDVRVAGITADDTNNAYVAQWENDANDQYRIDLYVTKVNLFQANLDLLGGSLDTDYDGNNLCAPSPVLYNSQPVVAYSVQRSPWSSESLRHIYVKRWNGSAWSDMGTGPVSALSTTDHYDSNHPSLLVVGNDLYLAWEETGVYGGTGLYVARWDEANNRWNIDEKDQDIASDVSTDTLDPSLAYNSTDGYLYIAFEAMIDGHPQIYVKRRRL